MTETAERLAHAIALLERIARDGHVREDSAARWSAVIAQASEGRTAQAAAEVLDMRQTGELREEDNERALEAVHELEAIGDDSDDSAGQGDGSEGTQGSEGAEGSNEGSEASGEGDQTGQGDAGAAEG